MHLQMCHRCLSVLFQIKTPQPLIPAIWNQSYIFAFSLFFLFSFLKFIILLLDYFISYHNNKQIHYKYAETEQTYSSLS